ncbi:MAG: hypothetical protein GEV06_07185 [Luteitalea sp.]|nr:hypothetical protein [Luteitalea sp.]
MVAFGQGPAMSGPGVTTKVRRNRTRPMEGTRPATVTRSHGPAFGVGRRQGFSAGSGCRPCRIRRPGRGWSRLSCPWTQRVRLLTMRFPVERPAGIQSERTSVDTILVALSRVCGRPTFHVVCGYVFGSVARRDAGPLSDVDLAILFDDDVDVSRRFELAAALVEEAERATEQQVDLAILNEAPPLLRHRVVRDGRLLYTRDERRRVAFEARALTEYLDFQPVLARFDRILLSRAREGRFGT